VERAEFVKPAPEAADPLPIEEVATPSVASIEELAHFLGIPKSQTLKAVFYVAEGELMFVVIRGDLEVNEVKLRNALKGAELRLASEAEVTQAGLVAGFASPVGLRGIRTIADDSILMGSNFVAGANKANYHLRNVNYPRDFTADLITDIALAQPGQACPRCGGALQTIRGIEVGHVFKLGSVFSERIGATYLGQDGVERPLIMGCYGIGTGRLLAAAVEQNHDEKGIIWPPSIAPYHIYLCALSLDRPEVAEAAEGLYQALTEAGFEVLYDDRMESPGVKFNDADLIGLPIRLTVSPRTLRTASAEVKRRTEQEAELTPLGEVAGRLRELLSLK